MPVGEDFEDTEFSVPRDRLIEAGHRVTVLGRKAGAMITGKRGKAAAKIELAGARAVASAVHATTTGAGRHPARRPPSTEAATYSTGFTTVT